MGDELGAHVSASGGVDRAPERAFSAARRAQVDRLVCLSIQELIGMTGGGIKSADDIQRILRFVSDHIEISSVSSATADIQRAIPVLRAKLEAGDVPAFYDALNGSNEVCKRVGGYESASSR